MEININKIIEILNHPNDLRKPWMTARLITKRLGLEKSSVTGVEEAMINYCKKAFDENRNPEIRYSSLPGLRLT